MARHNREGSGSDQRGHQYIVSYQPDWLSHIKVTRALESGRQSTKTLYRVSEAAEDRPGSRVRTGLASSEQGLDIEISVEDPRRVIRRIIVETVLPDLPEEDAAVSFAIDVAPPPPAAPARRRRGR